MTDLVNEFRVLLGRVFELSRRYSISYRDFFYLLVWSYGYIEGEIHDKRVKLVEEFRRLSSMVTRLPDSLHDLKVEVRRLKEEGYKPFLVDCLGLPEAYEVYTRAVEKCGVLGAVLKPFINVRGLTQAFKNVFAESSMLLIAKAMGTSLYKSIDRIVHSELGEPMELDNLISLADARLRSVAEGIARDAIDSKKAFIVADHGYDVIQSMRNTYYVGHGQNSKLARIAPVIVIECS